MEVSTKRFLGYVFLPRLVPRVRELFQFAFSHFAYFIALLFESVRLLPSNHPYLQSIYFGQYKTSQVIREAYKRLVFSRKHIDQVAIFSIICLGIVLFFIQLIIITVTIFFPSALAGTIADPQTLDEVFASPAGFTLSSIIGTEFPCHDIAFMLMDRVFGVVDMFNSRYNPGPGGCAVLGVSGFVPEFPYPYHYGLQFLFTTYSVAILTVALIVLTYFVITILAETVRDGTPFGKRFNRVWAPIRLILAFGLLVPLSNGLNAAQYMVLVSAKWGSGFATNGLTYYYGEIQDAGAGATPFGNRDTLLAEPNYPDPINMLHFILTARACQYAVQFEAKYNDDLPVITDRVTAPIRGYYFRQIPVGGPGAGQGVYAAELEGFDEQDVGTIFNQTSLPGIAVNTDFKTLVITFGHASNDPAVDLYPSSQGGVEPYCGVMSMALAAADEEMAYDIQGSYVNILSQMWNDDEIIQAAAAIARTKLDNVDNCDATFYPNCAVAPIPPMSDFKARKVDEYATEINAQLDAIFESYRDGSEYTDIEWCGPTADRTFSTTDYTGTEAPGAPGTINYVADPYYLKYGWAGAAICYNRLAQHNGAITTAARTIPSPYRWPKPLEWVQQRRQASEKNITALERFNPMVTGENGISDIFQGEDVEGTRSIAHASYEAYRLWLEPGLGSGEGGTAELSGRGVEDVVNLIFGTEGIFNMSKPENRDIHPLALLASAGRGLVDSAIAKIGLAGAAGIGGAIVTPLAGIGNVASSFMLTAATISMSAGFVLYYLVPLLPFMYFFFAVATWVKTIFEAMVGVPLWALAHLRIDGDGIPGNAAMAGYLLILEIFLRPILIVFGLIASSLIFSALAKVLNEMWQLVVANLTGFDRVEAEKGGWDPLDIRFWRTPIDEFFYTIIYAIIIYMFALASFKLVDLIPNFILRWIGQNVDAFGEGQEDYTSQLSQKATFGFSAASSKVINAGESVGQISQQAQGYRQARANYTASGAAD